MSGIKLLVTWKNKPVRQSFTPVEELPHAMKRQRAVFVQTKLIVQARHHGYSRKSLEPHQRKLNRLKRLL